MAFGCRKGRWVCWNRMTTNSRERESCRWFRIASECKDFQEFGLMGWEGRKGQKTGTPFSPQTRPPSRKTHPLAPLNPLLPYSCSSFLPLIMLLLCR